MDFSSVRVHQGTQAEAMGAIAYTQGQDVHFAPGHYRPHSLSGQELLGHELAHVVQQAQGRVRATRQMKGLGLNDDDRLEREADAMGRAAAHGGTVRDAHELTGERMGPLPAPLSRTAPIQRAVRPQIATALTPEAAAAAPQDLIAAYDAAWAHLWGNWVARHLYTVVDAHQSDVVVQVGAGDTRVGGDTQIGWDMEFNPWLFGTFGDQPRLNFAGAPGQIQAAPNHLMGTISPAMLLMHEFGHVKQDIEAQQFHAQSPHASLGYIRDYTTWLNGVHTLLSILHTQAGGQAPNLPDPHEDVMENDNVTRHERRAQASQGDALRGNYHNTLVFNDLDAQAKRIMTGMGVSPTTAPPQLPAMVTRSIHLHHAPVAPNVNSILTHITMLRGLIQTLNLTLPPTYPGWKRAQGTTLDAHLQAAHAFWLARDALALQQAMVPAARAAPTFQNP